MKPKIDRSGQTINQLTLLYPMRNPSGIAGYMCRCVCGTEKWVRTIYIVRNQSRSCGCTYVNHFKGVTGPAIPAYRHGGTHTPLFTIWQGMMRRCHSPTEQGYARYGARGIVVCERWHSFENFRDDIGERPSPEHSIDRYPDRHGNYEPGNVRWATKREQTLNRDVTITLTAFGESKPLADWARDERCVVGYSTLIERHRRGWPHETIITKPSRHKNKTGKQLAREA